MAISLELARLITYRAAQDTDKGVKSSYYASIAKCFAADSAMQTTTNAVQVIFLYILRKAFLRYLVETVSMKNILWKN